MCLTCRPQLFMRFDFRKAKGNRSVAFCAHGRAIRRSLATNQLHEPYAHHRANSSNNEAVEIKTSHTGATE